jgi:hypothetical protein
VYGTVASIERRHRTYSRSWAVYGAVRSVYEMGGSYTVPPVNLHRYTATYRRQQPASSAACNRRLRLPSRPMRESNDAPASVRDLARETVLWLTPISAAIARSDFSGFNRTARPMYCRKFCNQINGVQWQFSPLLPDLLPIRRLEERPNASGMSCDDEGIGRSDCRKAGPRPANQQARRGLNSAANSSLSVSLGPCKNREQPAQSTLKLSSSSLRS